MYDENKTWKESMLLPGPLSVFFISHSYCCVLFPWISFVWRRAAFSRTRTRLLDCKDGRPAVVVSEGGIFELTKSCGQARLSDGNCWVTAWGAVSVQPRRCRRGFTVVLRVCVVTANASLTQASAVSSFFNCPDGWATSERELVVEEMASDW